MKKSNFGDTFTSDISGQPGWDAMMEDLVGLNIRGLRTIGTIFASPQKVYAAARTPDWHKRAYTPSLRLFISLAMLVLVLQAFWAGADGHVSTLISQTIQGDLNTGVAPELLPFIDPQDIWQTAIVSLPIATIAIMLMFAFLLRIWGKDTNGVTRVRYYFLSAIPGWIVSFSLSIIVENLTLATAITILGISPFITLFVDALSAWRGNPGQYQKFARLWRSGLFGVTNFIAYNLAGFIMLTYASAVVTNNAVAAATAAGIPLTPS